MPRQNPGRDERRILKSVVHHTERTGPPTFDVIAKTSGRDLDTTAGTCSWLITNGYLEVTPKKVLILTTKGEEALQEAAQQQQQQQPKGGRR